jgi:hypothetical protein
MEGQLEQFEIQQDKVQPYLDHRKKLLDLGLAIPIIQQATRLTEEEIRAL